MLRTGEKAALSTGVKGLRLGAVLVIAGLTGCASGSFSTPSQPPSGPSAPQPSNPSSLPPLAAATAANEYVGTQVPGSSAPENTVALTIDQTDVEFSYKNIPIPGATSNPAPNSLGLLAEWADFRSLGDITGVANGLPGAQYYGLAVEEPSRFSFFADNSSGQVAALVPKQSSACITPTAAATYQFVTLLGANFLPSSDAAWGTVQVAASGSGFSFSDSAQYTETGTKASTGQIPFAAGKCVQSSVNPELGYFIDTPASAATGSTEIRSFLGPTGILVSNLQGTDGQGNQLPLPGVLAMVQPSSAIDVADVIGTTNQNLYRAFVYELGGSPAVQYGLFGFDTFLFDANLQSLFTSTHTSGMLGNWEILSSGASLGYGSGGGLVFGKQDASRPGLFPNAKFLYQQDACPAGTELFGSAAVPGTTPVHYCSSPAVAMVGQHNGKYVIIVTGISVAANMSPLTVIDAPTVFVLVQN